MDAKYKYLPFSTGLTVIAPNPKSSGIKVLITDVCTKNVVAILN
jgi:hypothetical protein